MLVQQTARQLHNLKVPRVLLKLDITQAFESVSSLFFWRSYVIWDSDFAEGSGFPSCLPLAMVSTRVLINGVPGPPIPHPRGLRQGDPLSPLLFVMVIDILNHMIQQAVQVGVLQRLTSRHFASSVSLYADDVVIFWHPDEQDLIATRGILDVFGVASGYTLTSPNVQPLLFNAHLPSLRTLRTAWHARSPHSRQPISVFHSIRKTLTLALQPLVYKLEKKLST